ncbi:hypothetical protein D9M69_447710 [compost metagenome]
MLRLNAWAWQQGHDCALAGGSGAQCPYSARSHEAWSWVSGWIEGDARRRQRMFRDGARRGASSVGSVCAPDGGT